MSRRFSVNDVALKSGISLKTYYRIEAANDSVAIKHYLKACVLLDVDFEKILNKELATRRKRV